MQNVACQFAKFMKQLMGHYKLDLIINILIVLIMTFVLIFRCECGLP